LTSLSFEELGYTHCVVKCQLAYRYCSHKSE